LFLPSKTNLGKPREGLAYRIADTALLGPEGSVIWAPFVQWEPAPVSISADEAMAAATGGLEGKSALNEARQFLMELLADGALPQKEIMLGQWRKNGNGDGKQHEEAKPPARLWSVLITFHPSEPRS
jgi:hypothetical protein